MSKDIVEITQADREAAADLAEWLADMCSIGGHEVAAIRNGVWDEDTHDLGVILQAFVHHRIDHIREMRKALEPARDALNAMMDAWFDYHDAHSLTQPVTSHAGNAFDKALAAREQIDAALTAGSGA